jgi:microcystin-dependent protein
VTSTAAELNILDGVTATATELNYMDGVTSNVQAQIDGAGISGQVAAFAFSTAPTGWLECDGSTISRTTYSTLFAAIGDAFGAGDGSTTFKVPDMRGEFIRGWDNGRGVDSSRAIGSTQTDALTDHRHLSANGTQFATTSSGTMTGPSSSGSSQPRGLTDFIFGGAGGDTETRPRNIAMMYCIKF